MKRICLLTGASGYLGTEFMERYAERYQIIAVHHRNPIAFATQDQVSVDPLFPSQPTKTDGQRVYSIRADLSRCQEIERLVSEVTSRFGRIDLLINGAALRSWDPLLTAGGLDLSEPLLHVNVLAPLRLSVGLAQRLWRSDPDTNLRFNRNIINLSSTTGLFVYPDLGQTLYAISKAALNHLTYHLASEFWDIGIRVNAVALDAFPSRFSTDDVLKEIVRLDDSDQTGQVLRVGQDA